MANETIGRVRCPRHGDTDVWGEVSKNKNNRLYYRCGTPALKWRDGCGLVDDAGANFQEWMVTHAKLYGAAGPPPEPDKLDPPEVQPLPEVTPMPEETKVIKTKTVVIPKAKPKAKKPAEEAPAGDLVEGDLETHDGDDGEDWLL